MNTLDMNGHGYFVNNEILMSNWGFLTSQWPHYSFSLLSLGAKSWQCWAVTARSMNENAQSRTQIQVWVTQARWKGSRSSSSKNSLHSRRGKQLNSTKLVRPHATTRRRECTLHALNKRFCVLRAWSHSQREARAIKEALCAISHHES